MKPRFFVLTFFLAATLILPPLTFAQPAGPAPDTASVTNSTYNFLADLRPSGYVTTAINLLFGGSGVAAFIYLLWGGFQWVTSGGDKEALDKARKRVTHALIGLALVFSAYAGMFIVQALFGITAIQLPFQPIGSAPAPLPPASTPPPATTATPPAGIGIAACPCFTGPGGCAPSIGTIANQGGGICAQCTSGGWTNVPGNCTGVVITCLPCS